MNESDLIRKLRLISKLMTSETRKQTISSISRSKCNLTVIFRQLIEYNMRIIFIEKSYANSDGGNSPRPFSGKS